MQVCDIWRKQVAGAASADKLLQQGSDDSCQVQLTVSQLPFAGERALMAKCCDHTLDTLPLNAQLTTTESGSCKKPDSVLLFFVVEGMQRKE